MTDEGLDLLAFCGLYCGDCAGYTGDIAEGAKAVIETLERYKFDRTAPQLFSEEFGDYGEWLEKLQFMAGLKCEAVCKQRDPSCEIAKCCLGKGYLACYECEGFEDCEKLKGHEALHGASHIHNLRAMRDIGPEAWIASGKRLWFAGDAAEGE